MACFTLSEVVWRHRRWRLIWSGYALAGWVDAVRSAQYRRAMIDWIDAGRPLPVEGYIVAWIEKERMGG